MSSERMLHPVDDQGHEDQQHARHQAGLWAHTDSLLSSIRSWCRLLLSIQLPGLRLAVLGLKRRGARPQGVEDGPTAHPHLQVPALG